MSKKLIDVSFQLQKLNEQLFQLQNLMTYIF